LRNPRTKYKRSKNFFWSHLLRVSLAAIGRDWPRLAAIVTAIGRDCYCDWPRLLQRLAAIVTAIGRDCYSDWPRLLQPLAQSLIGGPGTVRAGITRMQGRRKKERGEERKKGEKKERKGGVTLATPVSAVRLQMWMKVMWMK